MGDFFSRLAERTLGLAPVVQPDLMPVLLPVAESEVVSDALPGLQDTRERTAVPARKAAPYDDNDSLSRNMSITEIAIVAGDMPQGLTQGWDQAAALAARDHRAVDRQLEAPNRERAAVASPMAMTQAKPNEVELSRNHLNREFKTGEPTSPAEMRQSIHASAVMAQSKPSAVGPTATPTIQISIGTVEIRAVTPAPTAAPQRSAERRGNPRLSLEEYLRQRNEGRR
jgi:hypothetical protein